MFSNKSRIRSRKKLKNEIRRHYYDESSEEEEKPTWQVTFKSLTCRELK